MEQTPRNAIEENGLTDIRRLTACLFLCLLPLLCQAQPLQPVIDIASQEYLTFSKAAILMGCSRQYVYKLVNEGKLPVSRISSRMAFIRKADIEKMLAGNPYHRVLPTSKPKNPSSLSLKKGHDSSKSTRKENSFQDIEPLEYISGEDVMATYKVKKSWLYVSAKRNNIPATEGTQEPPEQKLSDHRHLFLGYLGLFPSKRIQK